MPRLNRTFVDNLQPREVEYVVMDSDVPCFGVRVSPKARKSYFTRLRIGGGRQADERRVKIGRHGEITPEAARQAAKNMLAKARLGEDPTAEARTRRESLTVEDLVNEWVAGPGKRTRKGALKSDNSYSSDKARLLNHVVPILGREKLCDLKRSHVEKLRDAVAAGKSATTRTKTKPRGYKEVRGGEGVAARTVAGFSTLLGHAVEHGYMEKNIALGVHKPQPNQCERFLSIDEIRRVLNELDRRSTDHPKGATILRLLMLTGCRCNEIAGLRWSEVDLNSGVLRLQKTKTGSRIVYLSDPAITLIRKLKQIDGSSWVFPAVRGTGHYLGTPKVWRKILASTGLAGVRIHDLRHTFASTAAAQGTSLQMIAELLGHQEVRTTARYAHLAASAVRIAANNVALAIENKSSIGSN